MVEALVEYMLSNRAVACETSIEWCMEKITQDASKLSERQKGFKTLKIGTVHTMVRKGLISSNFISFQ